jgi:hypothetical protein
MMRNLLLISPYLLPITTSINNGLRLESDSNRVKLGASKCQLLLNDKNREE